MAHGSPTRRRFYVDLSQRDEERISEDSADASDIDGAAKDNDSREAELVDPVHAGAGEQSLAVEKEASPVEVRGCLLLFSLFCRRTAFDIGVQTI